MTHTVTVVPDGKKFIVKCETCAYVDDQPIHLKDAKRLKEKHIQIEEQKEKEKL